MVAMTFKVMDRRDPSAKVVRLQPDGYTLQFMHGSCTVYAQMLGYIAAWCSSMFCDCIIRR